MWQIRSQLETERADCKLIKEECDERLDSNYKLQEELSDREKEIAELRSELESTKFQLENRPATSGHLYQEIEQLKERNRLLQIKNREERQKLEEELAALKYRDESQSRRLQEKQARLDELEIQIEEAQIAKPEPETAIDLSEQVPQIINFLKELLPPDTKWPKRVLPKLRQFLEPKEEKNND